jgi:hypothetical protein
MKTIRYKSRGNDVEVLEAMLKELGYDLDPNTYFDLETHNAVKDFQKQYQLVIDGIVGPKTWSKLFAVRDTSLNDYHEKLLKELDLVAFAEKYILDLALVKAVNEVESRGEGFLRDGRPKILFEGHIFWRQLVNAGLNPADYVNDYTQNVLYEDWDKTHYEGNEKEYFRLEKAAGMSDLPEIHDAAFMSASWGSFQIMGFHYKSLGYFSIDHFVSNMYQKEAKHLEAFGRFLEVNNLIRPLKERDWHSFARGYNGPGYKQNNYHIKLQQAYERHI